MDIDSLMEDIRVEIVKIYNVCCEPTVLDAKQTIDILQEIEVKLNNNMRDIKQFHDTGKEHARLVIQQVQLRRDEWFQRKQRKMAQDRQDR